MTALIDQSPPRTEIAGGATRRSEAKPRENWRWSATSRNRRNEQRTIRIAILGCGTVGREVALQILSRRDRWLADAGIRVELARILVRNHSRDRGIDPTLLVTRISDVLAAKPDLVIEAMGGVDQAGEFVAAALRRGIPVVTANKSLIAHEGDRLRSIASQNRASLFCEACVGGAVPVLAALRQLRGDRLRSIRGIINGSCNHILSRMTEERITFDEALSEAIHAGFVEPDPSADISGRDSAEKLCVLTAAAGFSDITPSQIDTTGIESITPAGINAAKSHGYVVKLVAELNASDEGISLSVAPTLVPRRHALARPRGAENVIIVESELGGMLTLQGLGAGPKPTASAILGDVWRAIDNEDGTISFTSRPNDSAAFVPADNRRWFVRLTNPSRGLTPQDLMDGLRSQGIEAQHIQLCGDAVEIITGPASRSAVASACTRVDTRAKCFVARILD